MEADVVQEHPLAASPARRIPLAGWLQFPRRLLLLLLAYGMALFLLAVLRQAVSAASPAGAAIDWAMSTKSKHLVSEIVEPSMYPTLLLLAGAMVLAVVLAASMLVASGLVSRLESRFAVPGFIIAKAGKLWVFFWSPLPGLVVGIFLIVVVSIRLGWFPIIGMSMDFESPNYIDVFKSLILPGLTLALFPALIIAQAAARQIGAAWAGGGRARVSLGLGVVGDLLAQTGGLLAASLIVEQMFSWPGIGRVALTAMRIGDLPILFAALGAYAFLTLISRIAAELCWWLARLIAPADARPAAMPQRPPHRMARIAWAALLVALVLVPIGFTLAGLSMRINVFDASADPSPEHPWGTDFQGRDLQAKLVVAASNSLRTAGLAGLAATLAAALGVVLTGALSSRRTWWSESLSDLLLLPSDVMLFFPAVLGAIVLILFVVPHSGDSMPAVVAVAIGVLAPRVVRAGRALWLAAPQAGSRWGAAVRGALALYLGSVFAALWLFFALEYLGAVEPSAPTLGNSLYELLVRSGSNSQLLLIALIPTSVMPIIYLVSDAMAGGFDSKGVFVHLNE
ncbi:MAG: hypothetical protein HZB53_06695 [Chloroflexi bacterium]|nr:hypothetical protein [Chloroflexota bacterium]